MTKTRNFDEEEHFKDLRLPYLEGLLEPEERLKVEQHLQTCPECSKELQELIRWDALLRDEKEIYCPEPWVLFDAARGLDLEKGDVRKHVDTCHSCRTELKSFEDLSRGETLPQELWEKMTSSGKRPTIVEEETWLTRRIRDFFDTMRDFVRMPVFGLATAVAAVILLVIFFPSGGKIPVVGLSDERWQPSALERGLMGREARQVPDMGRATKEKAAIVILFKDFPSPPDQQAIDALYGSLYPAQDVRERFEMVSPAAVREAVSRHRISVTKREDLVTGLLKAVGTTRVLLLTVVGPNAPYTIRAEFLDTTSGSVLAQKTVKNVEYDRLKNSLDELAHDILVGRRKGDT